MKAFTGTLEIALKAKDRREAQLGGTATGLKIDNPDDAAPRMRVAVSQELFIEELEANPSKAAGTVEAFKQTFEHWQAYNQTEFVDQLTRKEMLGFTGWLKTKIGNKQRTAGKKLLNMSQWQRWAMKLKAGEGLVTTKDAGIDPDEFAVDVYEPEDIYDFLNNCNEYEHLLFTFYLQSGFRMSEVMYLHWTDLNLLSGTATVQAKPQYNWKPKNKLSRTVKLPTTLVDRLIVLREDRPRTKLVFGTRSDKPDTHMLERCKWIARRGKLDEEMYYLHKFRATCATMLLRKGVDIVQVQQYLGHKDIASTMRYLAAVKAEAMGDMIDKVWARPAVSKPYWAED
jgi:integrase/recombinase XerD